MAFAMGSTILSAFCSVTISGLIFSVILLKLGTAIESPEVLRYILIGTLPLSVVVGFALLRFYRQLCVGVGFLAVFLSMIACMPMESIAYVLSAWEMRGLEIFNRSHLPTLIVLLFGWSVVIALLATLLMYSYICLQKLLAREDRV
jgi:hypothetical protein